MCKEALCEDIHIMCWRCLYGGACVQMHYVRMYRWRCRCGGDAGGRLASFKRDLELCLHCVVAAEDVLCEDVDVRTGDVRTKVHV